MLVKKISPAKAQSNPDLVFFFAPLRENFLSHSATSDTANLALNAFLFSFAEGCFIYLLHMAIHP